MLEFCLKLRTWIYFDYAMQWQSVLNSVKSINRKTIFQIGFKNRKKGTSLVAQWLRILLPMQGTWVQALVWEDPTCCGATKPMCHNHWACALEPVRHNYWARAPQLLSLSATATEACAPIARALQQEKPPQWEARAPQRRVAPTRRN